MICPKCGGVMSEGEEFFTCSCGTRIINLGGGRCPALTKYFSRKYHIGQSDGAIVGIVKKVQTIKNVGVLSG